MKNYCKICKGTMTKIIATNCKDYVRIWLFASVGGLYIFFNV